MQESVDEVVEKLEEGSSEVMPNVVYRRRLYLVLVVDDCLEASWAVDGFVDLVDDPVVEEMEE